MKDWRGHHKGLIVDFSSPRPLVRAYVALFEHLCLTLVNVERRLLVVTSPARGDGRTNVAANLSLCCARLGHQRTLLVDTDFERPQLARLFKVRSSGGLANVLAGRGAWQDQLRPIQDGRLSLLPAGDNVSSLVAQPTERLTRLLEEWQREFDWIIVDTPPVLQSANALVFGRRATGAVLVVRAGRTRAEVVHEAAKQLRDGSVALVGAVLNRRRYVIPQWVYRRL